MIRLRRLLTDGRQRTVLPELISGIAALVVIVIWASNRGGFPTEDLYGGGLALLGLLTATAFGWRRRMSSLAPLTMAAIVFFGSFVLWGFLSISWAEAPGDAWEGANRNALFFAVFLLFAIPRWRSSSAALWIGIWAFAVAILGWIEILGASASSDPALLLVESRFAEPTGYPNASAALFALPFFGALVLSAQREVPLGGRALLLGVAGALMQLALLPQSRGTQVAGGIALLALILIGPGKLRIGVAFAVVGVVTLVTASPALEVYSIAKDGGDLGSAFGSAALGIGISFMVLTLAGGLLAWLDGRHRLGQAARKSVTKAVASLAILITVGGCVVAGSIGNPIDWTQERWEEFKTGEEQSNANDVRYGVSGRGRYDYWRVSVDEFRDHPIKGLGLQGFAPAYLQDRQTLTEPRYVHSQPLETLAELGALGGLLLGGFLTATVVGVVRVRRRGMGPLAKATAGAVLATLVYAFIHSSVDWLWQFPALGAPVFAMLGLATQLPRVDSPDEGDYRASLLPGPVLGAVGVAFAATALAISFALPWVAARYSGEALASWTEDRAAAYRQLQHAGELNFLSARPAVAAGTIASLTGDREMMRISFREALDREPSNWYSQMQLGVLAAATGDGREALRRLEAARRISPNDPLIQTYIRRVEAEDDVSTAGLNEDLTTKLCSRIGQTPQTIGCSA